MKEELIEVVDHLLRAIRFKPPGGSFSFFWNKENPLLPFGSRAYQFYLDSDALQAATLTLLNKQSVLLSGTPLRGVHSMLLAFFKSNLELFDADALMGAHRVLSTALEITQLDRGQIASALYDYLQNVMQVRLYLIPARRLSTVANHVGRRILVLQPAENLHEALPQLSFRIPPLNGFQTPPFKSDKAEGRLEEKDCWLGCLARSDQEGKNLLEALLGAISLLLPHPASRNFSMAERSPWTYCLGGQWIARLGPPTFPPIGDHSLGADQLDGLAELLEGTRSEDDQRRLEVGLQFVGAGWEPPSRLSFLHNAIAFDAFFGVKGRVNATIKAAVIKHAGSIASIGDRISTLLSIRNSLMHGEIGIVESSPEYLSYYKAYGHDPQEDQINILRVCVRSLAGMR